MSQAKAAAKRPVSNMTRRQNRYGYGFIMLWLIGLFVFTLIPMLFSLFLSFCKLGHCNGLVHDQVHRPGKLPEDL